MRLLRANLRKLVRRPASWVTLVLLVALLALIYLALIAASQTSADPQAALGARLFVTFPGAYELVLTLILGIGGLLAVTYGAAIAGSEWTWGTLKAAVARGESRARYTLLGYAAVALFTILGLVLAFLLGVLASMLGATLLNVGLGGMTDPDGLARLPELFGRSALALSMNAAFGYAVATVARSQLAGIGVGIGLYFAEGIAGIFLSDVVQVVPVLRLGRGDVVRRGRGPEHGRRRADRRRRSSTRTRRSSSSACGSWWRSRWRRCSPSGRRSAAEAPADPSVRTARASALNPGRASAPAGDRGEHALRERDEVGGPQLDLEATATRRHVDRRPVRRARVHDRRQRTSRAEGRDPAEDVARRLLGVRGPARSWPCDPRARPRRP